MEKIRREADESFLGETPRHRPLAVIQAAIAMHEHDGRARVAGGRPREETVNDFLAAPVSGMHGDDSFGHGFDSP